MALALPALMCVASGLVVVSLCWTRRSPLASDLLLRVSLAVGFGLGIFSVIYFVVRLSGATHLMLVDAAVFLVLLVVFLVFRSRAATTAPAGSSVPMHDAASWFRIVLAVAFVIALWVSLYSAVMRTRAHPHGDGWDAFAIWNLHARFLFRGGAHWRDGFTALIPWSHPDYPLLLPGAVAHFWTLLGRDHPAVPAVIGFIFTFSTIAVMFSALYILRGSTPAMLGGIALLATPSYLELGTWQYADVPLSFFFLATIVLLHLHDDAAKDDGAQDYFLHRSPRLLVLAGLAAGFAAWTKNEGVLFLGAVLLARFLARVRRRNMESEGRAADATSTMPMLVAVVPVLLVIAYFKHFIAPPGDLFSDPATMLHKVLDPARYWAVTKWYGKEFLLFGHWWLIPTTLLMVVYYFVAGKDDRDQTPALRASILALAITLAGYFVIYLITPYDIYWHLRFSLSRLFLQLWPSAIFLFFLTVGGPASQRSLKPPFAP